MRIIATYLLTSTLVICSHRQEVHPVKFKDSTYSSLLSVPEGDRTILVGRAEKITFVRQGSRSERVVIDIHVIAGAETSVGRSVQFTKYSQNQPVVVLGSDYVIAGYRGEWAPALQLVEALPLGEQNGQAVLNSVINELMRFAKARSPGS